MGNNKFDRFGIMIDNSRNAVMNVKSFKKMIDLMEKMGYNFLMLYTEDTYEVQNQQYFGHLRGRYTEAELKELDKYGRKHGIELMPCIQTLAHLDAILHWPKYYDLRDRDNILCAGEERVYELIEDMFATLDRAFTSRTVNIGMDEAEAIGLGKYMKLHGIENRTDILLRHLERVSEIAKKYGFELLMWGDMFFKLANNTGDYYNAEIDVSLKSKIPSNVKLIYWDYYSTEKEHYDKNLLHHQKVCSDAWFAGGAWTWAGYVPHNVYSLKSTKAALSSCISNGVKNAFITMWGDNGGECSRFSVLPTLFAASQYACGNFDMDDIKAKFSETFNIGFDSFMLLDLPDTPNTFGDICNPDKYMLYNDCLMGLFDCTVKEDEAERYAACAERLRKYENNMDFGTLFASAGRLCEVLAVKYDIGVRTRAAYLGKDKSALEKMIPVYEQLISRLQIFYDSYEKQWMEENKPFGFEVIDARLGGLMLRVKHCKKRIEQYLDGSLERIEELEEPVLDYEGFGEPKHIPMCYNNWATTFTASII